MQNQTKKPDNVDEIIKILQQYSISPGINLRETANFGYGALIDQGLLFSPEEFNEDEVTTKFLNAQVITILAEQLGLMSKAQSSIYVQAHVTITLAIIYYEYTLTLALVKNPAAPQDAKEKAEFAIEIMRESALSIKNTVLKYREDLEPALKLFKDATILNNAELQDGELPC